MKIIAKILWSVVGFMALIDYVMATEGETKVESRPPLKILLGKDFEFRDTPWDPSTLQARLQLEINLAARDAAPSVRTYEYRYSLEKWASGETLKIEIPFVKDALSVRRLVFHLERVRPEVKGDGIKMSSVIRVLSLFPKQLQDLTQSERERYRNFSEDSHDCSEEMVTLVNISEVRVDYSLDPQTLNLVSSRSSSRQS